MALTSSLSYLLISHNLFTIHLLAAAQFAWTVRAAIQLGEGHVLGMAASIIIFKQKYRLSKSSKPKYLVGCKCST